MRPAPGHNLYKEKKDKNWHISSERKSGIPSYWEKLGTPAKKISQRQKISGRIQKADRVVVNLFNIPEALGTFVELVQWLREIHILC